MSVINQMLKELEERNTPQHTHATSAGAPQSVVATSKFKIVLWVLLIVLINIVGIYVWNLYSENQSLKSADHNQPETLAIKKEVLNPKAFSKINETIQLEVTPTQDTVIVNKENVSKKSREYIEPEKTNTKVAVKQVKPERNNIVVTPLGDKKDDKSKKIAQVESPSADKKQTSLSISRSHLSPERVVANKLKKAELAISDNNIAKAEQLFEDVLLIQPEQKEARKQLAALWFGRKLYRPALNLLSQGIALYPNDNDFRLMKARIFLNQNNTKEAFNVLNGFSTAQNVEYQVLLANTAQLLKKSNSAILAYRQLVELEPHKGKWWMGLAVELDRESQFKEAKSAYAMALSTQSLSSNSVQFVEQRMLELGE